ncbi:Hypothetical protein NTJ_12268 [Nesidiocoris tenuis]|uniref:Uncharacterized protein n=1 Tax=Nesidiocoris tenuis TaxID=355587 RepID=A0ABN7B8G4_9HEMI|nr:Hypothetical protein NTJ_12268 [Nesidiocoris tenuis]
MPGLRGNICWGHRAFGMFGEYLPGDVQHSPVHVSTNAYYGQHQVIEPRAVQGDSPMDVSEPIRNLKRFRTESCQPHIVKRIRQDEKKQEETDLQFLEHYLKQTHGCDYFSYKQFDVK